MKPFDNWGKTLDKPEDRTAEAGAEERPGAKTIDLRGLKCPLPALRTRKALSRLAAGAPVTILADDPLARLDIAHLCREGGHALEAVEPLAAGGWRFRVRRAG